MLAPAPSTLHYFYCFYWKQRPELGEQGAGCVRSVSSHKGSSSHLPPYSGQPDPYPQPSLAQQACCLIPTKGFPAGGCGRGGVGETKAGGKLWEPGSSTVRPFDLVPWPAGADGSDSTMSTPCLLLSLLSATQTPGADWETEEGGRRKTQTEGEGSGANEHNEETDTEYADHLPPSSIHLWVQISLFPTHRLLVSPLPGVTPSFVCPLFYPSASRRTTRPCVAKHTLTGHQFASVFSKLC